MAKKNESVGVLDVPVSTGDGYYHLGLLPAGEKAFFPMPDKNKNGKMTLRPVNAWECWNNAEEAVGEKAIKIFIAKARQFFGLQVRGAHFPGVSVYADDDGETASKTPFPGGVAYLTADQVASIVKSCYRHILRCPNGVAKLDDPTQAVELIDLDHGSREETKRALGWTDEDFSREKIAGRAIETNNSFNPKTDRYVAEFVYIEKLAIDQNDVDPEDYKKNPNRFHYQWVGPVKKSFYTDPPKSVAKAYPNPTA